MKKLILAAGLLALASGAMAAGKPCEELKAERLRAKLDAKGVKGYTLEIVNKGDPAGKVVGTCEGGNKEIVYRRG